MSLKCKIGLHSWDGCTCSECGQMREEQHKWDGCICNICNKIRNEHHQMIANKCLKCGIEQGFFIDKRDEHNYKWVKIGEQVWMAENLAYKDIDGCWAYDNNELNIDKYGYLYHFIAAQRVCPLGWHLPTDEEWTTMKNYLGGENVAGGKLKETGTNHWLFPNHGANNESGFNALPSGGRFYDRAFKRVGIEGVWWSSTEDEQRSGNFWSYILYNDSSRLGIASGDKGFGFAIRCIRDY